MTWVKVGLILNVLGTVALAFSFGPNTEDAHQVVSGRKVQLAVFSHPRLFYLGLALVLAGFVVQLVAPV